MGVLNDEAVLALAQAGCIQNFALSSRGPGIISSGVTSAGYDIRLGRKFRVFTNTAGCVVDPKHFDPDDFVSHEGDTCIIPPNSFVLGESVERFDVPRDIVCIVLGKSTYARCGICTNFTPLEPGWRGIITIEIANLTPLPAKIYAGEGIAQVLFLRLEKPCKRSYADKGGLYQDQDGMTFPRV